MSELDDMKDRFDDFTDRVTDAAVQAEFETGEREATVAEAKQNALVRVARMTLGFVVVIIGIIALPLPGPGWLIIAAGLTILSKDVAWADRLLRYIRKRVPGIPEDGKIPRSSLVTMALITLAAVCASLWWTFGRGSDAIQAGTYDIASVAEPTASSSEPMEGLRATVSETGPLIIEAPGCGPIELPVAKRSKTTFVLANAPGVDTAGCEASVAAFVTAADGAELTFDYSTDGIVAWFFADDALSGLSVTDGNGEYRLEVASS